MSGGMAPIVLNFGTIKRQHQASASLSTGRSPGALSIRDWVGLKAGLDTVENGKCLVRVVNRTTIPRSSSP